MHCLQSAYCLSTHPPNHPTVPPPRTCSNKPGSERPITMYFTQPVYLLSTQPSNHSTTQLTHHSEAALSHHQCTVTNAGLIDRSYTESTQHTIHALNFSTTLLPNCTIIKYAVINLGLRNRSHCTVPNQPILCPQNFPTTLPFNYPRHSQSHNL